jgi:predicted RNase H-like HicB family nuclease
MTYDVILRKKQDKYIARVRDWPEVVIEEETREAALTWIKQHLSAYLSQAPEVIPIELEPVEVAAPPWLRFAGM